MRVALVTACYGAYDPVRSLPANHGFDDAVLVTDDRSLVTDTVSGIGGWRVVYEPRDEHPRLAAKRAKMMPWLYTDCDAAVWLDASFEVTGPLSKWVRPLLAGNDLIVWTHPEGRIGIEQEAPVCWDWPKYRDYDMRGQLAAYRAEGMPEKWGLFAAGTIGWVFTEGARRFGELWLEENRRWSVQDQVSLPYLLWSTGKRFGVWPANEYKNPYVSLRWDERPDPSR
jgi:hypothetical protein